MTEPCGALPRECLFIYFMMAIPTATWLSQVYDKGMDRFSRNATDKPMAMV
jgi:hypothetical protein